jgi:hypothetical protein
MRHTLLALALGATLLSTAQAESSAISASSTTSLAAGSLSDSVKGSSTSSSGNTTKTAAQGTYRVVQVQPTPGREGLVRLQLRPVDAPQAAGEFTLDLPHTVAGEQGLAAADLLQVREQPYGLAFARAGQAQPFFLALADEWRDALAPRRLDR